MSWRTSNSFSIGGGGEVTLSMFEDVDFSNRRYELKVEPYGEYSGGSVTMTVIEFGKLETLVTAMRRLIEHRDGFDRSPVVETAQSRLYNVLAYLRDHGYAPRYNGRPSCPFCENFVDDEETHVPGCVLVAGLEDQR